MQTGTILMGLSLVLVGGCDRDHRGRHANDEIHGGRWQLVQQPDAAAVWRLDTATGTLSYCNADFTNRVVLCIPQMVAPVEAAAAPAGTGTQPVMAPPAYPTQSRSPAP